MFFVTTVEQSDLLISVCFSFLLVSAALWFRNASTFSRLLGISFVSPLMLSSAAFLAQKKIVSVSLLALSETSLLFLILVVIIIKPKKNQFKLYAVLFPLFSLLLIFSCHSLVFLQYFLSEYQNPLIVILVVLAALLYFLRNEKALKGLLFWAVLLAAVGSHPVGMLYRNDLFTYSLLALKLSSFILFAVYLHDEYMKDMLSRVDDANKKQSVIERSIDYEVKKRIMEIERVNESLLKKTKTDAMTKLLNKVAIYDAIENQIVSRPKMEFTILLFDIDNFKNINDTMGHLMGDKCIKTVALLTKKSFRDFDIIGRYGGDEFLVLLPGTTVTNAIQVAERFRKKIEEQTNPKVTISMGIAAYPECGLTIKELFEVADEGLYRSKEKGRNSVSFMAIY